jgi:hypothetical protein
MSYIKLSQYKSSRTKENYTNNTLSDSIASIASPLVDTKQEDKNQTNGDIASGNEPTNLSTDSTFCSLVSKIKSYYGKTNENLIDSNSNYYKDLENIKDKTIRAISDFMSTSEYKQLKNNNITPLIMSDMDDTIWCSFPENVKAGFCYSPEDFNKFTSEGLFPPIFPALEILEFCKLNGIVPVFVTGRAATAEQADITSIQLNYFNMKAGSDYWGGQNGWGGGNGSDVSGDGGVRSIRGVFMHEGKDTRSGKGTTATKFKTTTRKWIETNGLPGIGKVKFIAGMGDQWSDSKGGYGGNIHIKLPNPMYFLP